MYRVAFFALAAIPGLAAWDTSGTSDFIGIGPLDSVRIDPATGHFVDGHGRTRIFHGMNVVYKKWPWFPPSEKFDPAESLDARTIDNLRQWGFNVVRLGVMWPGVEPVHKQIDHGYIKSIMNLSEQLAARGIYTLADLHQDLGSRRFCGEGIPEYYVDALLQDNTSALAKAAPFPKPLGPPSELRLNASGYPLLEDCLKRTFISYYVTWAVGALWGTVYTPGSELNQGFMRFWTEVATAFRHAPHLLGFELLNEPPGYCLDGTNLAACLRSAMVVWDDHVEVDRLAPLYQSAAEAIRRTGAKQPILYEATVPPKVGYHVFPKLPLKDDTQQGLAYHIYCLPSEGESHLIKDWVCDRFLDLFYNTYFPFLKKYPSIPGFMTEFGAVGTSPGELKHLRQLLTKADEKLQSWAYWMLKIYSDFTTINDEESLYDGEGELQTEKLKALSRTYAQAIAGVPQSMSFDPNTGDFHLAFNATVVGAPTEIFLNEDLYYQNGFVVDVQPKECLLRHQFEKNYLTFLLAAPSACRGMIVSISIKAEVDGPPSAAQLLV